MNKHSEMVFFVLFYIQINEPPQKGDLTIKARIAFIHPIDHSPKLAVL